MSKRGARNRSRRASPRRPAGRRTSVSRAVRTISNPASAPAASQQSLLTLIARAPNLTALLPQLHVHALRTAGGISSLLFERNARSGAWHATSAYGVSAFSAEPWVVSPEEAP